MSRVPLATYRLQLRKEFDFAAATAILPYLRRLGISHLYLSPITAARAGSTHGYDVIDYNVINPELGGEDGFVRLSDAVQAHGLGIIVDFVPNHMAASTENPWWFDVLRHGRGSRYAAYFDIDWRRFEGFRHPAVTLPLLDGSDDVTLAGIVIRDGSLVCSGVTLPLAEDTRPGPVAEVLAQQHYRLIPWQRAAQEINYRRFFDINDLVGMNADSAFDDMHRLVARLARAGRIDGLRLDHIDGLRDPTAYCTRLRRLLQQNGLREPYLIVEKILEAEEELPAFPGIQGTTGYEALNLLTRLLLDPTGMQILDRLWRNICNGCDDAQLRQTAKRQVLQELFPGGLDDLVDRLQAMDGSFPPAELRTALVEYLVRLPVYRTYVDAHGAAAADRQVIEAATGHDAASIFLRQTLTTPSEFTARLQQFSGPVMAKSVEDTLFYRNVRLLALNEVGGGPELPPLPTSAFHTAMRRRQMRQPHGLTATATHDTKRGEDARLRIAALSLMGEDWRAACSRFPTDPALSPTHLYMFYQSLLGAWPFDGLSEGFAARAKEFAIKALREGKERSRWIAPDLTYEQALTGFIDRLLLREDGAGFRRDFAPIAERAARLGAACSLAQIALKATLPGIPDFYQGSEGWDLSFVDPDNRRPVDYAWREACLSRANDWDALCQDWRGGAIKLTLTRFLLRLRREERELFESGEYIPLPARGPHADRIVAFARRRADRVLTVAVCTSPQGAEAGDWFDFSGLELDLPPPYRTTDRALLRFGVLPVAVFGIR